MNVEDVIQGTKVSLLEVYASDHIQFNQHHPNQIRLQTIFIGILKLKLKSLYVWSKIITSIASVVFFSNTTF